MSFTTRQGRAFYKRPLAVLGATALTVGAFGPAAQADSHVQSIAPACDGWTDPFGFTDIQGETQAYQDAINCLAWYDITRGRNATTYAPDNDVKRYEMALFISRTIGYIEESSDIDVVDPEDADDAGFEDIDGLTGPQQDAVAQLVELEIVQGKNADEFAPYESITRRDMARFIDRLVDNVVDGAPGADFYEADYTDLFVDVPRDLPGAEDIYSLRAEGIVQGESGNRYLPYASVDRKDMAFFVMRTVADLVEKEYIDALQPAPVTNQDFTVNPQEAATLTVAASEPDSTDDRTYTVSGLDDATTYTVALFDADNVTVDANGVVTFADTDNNDLADGVGDDSIAEITRTNSQTLTSAAGTATINPVNGTLNFTIDGVARGTVVPVLFVDANSDGQVNLDENNQPTEQFGVGGETTYLATPAVSGTYTNGTVNSVDKAANTFVATTGTGTFTFAYDSNDSYTIGGVSVGMTAFEAALSTGDTITTTYTTDTEGVSTFALLDVAPPAPESVQAVPGTGQTSNDITVTVTIPTGADYDSVVIQRAPVTGGTPGTWATIAQPTTDADATADGFQYVDNDVPAGTYLYRAALVKDGDQGDFSNAVEAISTTPAAPDTTAPTSVDAFVGTNAGSAFLLDVGDTFVVVFSEAVAPPTAGDTIRLTDEDGTVVDLVAGTPDGNFVLNTGPVTIGTTVYPAGRVLTVTRSDADVTLAAGTLAGLSIPATITAQSGTVDLAGNAWNLSGSADRTVDSE